MKKILSVFLLIGLMMPTWVSCSSDDDDSDYYVKYEVKNGQSNSSLVRRSCTWNITYKDVTKEATINNSNNWEGTYGPFKKGDKVYLNASRVQGTFNTVARISVSKDNAAFTIKAEIERQGNASLEYVIDY